jgi:glycosyltransferase involved in cell wall biosynthesis
MVLVDLGFKVLLVGRKRRCSLTMEERPYHVRRMRLLFEKGPAFYACYNVRLLLLLLCRRADLYVSNDLDTLIPNFLISRWRRKPLLYDSHEYFTGVPELAERPRIRGIWKWIERRCVPDLPLMITVNGSIAELYHKEYGVGVCVVRNVPESSFRGGEELTRADLELPAGKKILILQGSGINVQRGAEEAVEAMQYLEGVMLLIVGDGDVLPVLKRMVVQLNLSEKVRFVPRVPMSNLQAYTRVADGGLTLDKDTSINYRFSLPNKLFDYIHAGIPVLASDLPEIRKVVDGYEIGLITENHDPEVLAEKMKILLFDEASKVKWRANLPRAAADLCWEKEQVVLKEVIQKVFKQ